MKPVFLVIALSAVALADTESPSGNRTTPPTINSVSPRGVARGTTVEMTVEGLNLGNVIAHEDAIPELAWSAAGKTIKLFRASDLSEEKTLAGQSDWIYAIEFAPDSKTFAVGRFDGTLSIYDSERFTDQIELNHSNAKQAAPPEVAE
jgi:WD40 repeat protein